MHAMKSTSHLKRKWLLRSIYHQQTILFNINNESPFVIWIKIIRHFVRYHYSCKDCNIANGFNLASHIKAKYIGQRQTRALTFSKNFLRRGIDLYKVIEILMNIQLLYALIVKNSKYYNDSLNILDLIYTKCERQVLKVVRVSQ